MLDFFPFSFGFVSFVKSILLLLFLDFSLFSSKHVISYVLYKRMEMVPLVCIYFIVLEILFSILLKIFVMFDFRVNLHFLGNILYYLFFQIGEV